MSTRNPFIAPVVDIALRFIKQRRAITVSELAMYLSSAGFNVVGDDEFAAPGLPVIASGSTEFVRTIAALLENRRVRLDSTNPALLKLTSRWYDDCAASTPMKDNGDAGGHYHILTVRDPGGSLQIAECWEANPDLGLAQQYLDEFYLPDSFDEGWDAIYIVGCGPDRCRRDEICKLPVEEWGPPHWVNTTAFSGVDDYFNAPNSELADGPPF